jgi:hypothetical protein
MENADRHNGHGLTAVIGAMAMAMIALPSSVMAQQWVFTGQGSDGRQSRIDKDSISIDGNRRTVVTEDDYRSVAREKRALQTVRKQFDCSDHSMKLLAATVNMRDGSSKSYVFDQVTQFVKIPDQSVDAAQWTIACRGSLLDDLKLD